MRTPGKTRRLIGDRVELLRELQLQIGQVRPLLKSSIRSEAGLDLDELSRRITDLTGEPESPRIF